MFWLVDGDGIIGATIQLVFNDPNLSLKASTALTWTMLIVYGIGILYLLALLYFMLASKLFPLIP